MDGQPDIPEILNFRADRQFYPNVVAFFSSIVGLQALIDATNPMGIKPNQRLPIGGKVHQQLSISSYELFKHHCGRQIDTSELTAALCCMLANTAYETVKGANDRSPAFEFFRHVRNASSHGNAFSFRNNEPSRSAKWRGMEIDDSQQGAANPLQGTVCFFDLLGPADLVLLLWDIEQEINLGDA